MISQLSAGCCREEPVSRDSRLAGADAAVLHKKRNIVERAIKRTAAIPARVTAVQDPLQNLLRSPLRDPLRTSLQGC
ncbi:hypothetical protein ABZ721_40805 [Streptomyces sp. NPDC006733]|uniref:hypothetical protein n=1 Tax=Streptomyces sp. NPDC006733 TaxID=3155460 RepID=UPI0034052FE2